MYRCVSHQKYGTHEHASLELFVLVLTLFIFNAEFVLVLTLFIFKAPNYVLARTLTERVV